MVGIEGIQAEVSTTPEQPMAVGVALNGTPKSEGSGKPESLTIHVHRVARAQQLLASEEPRRLASARATFMDCGCSRAGSSGPVKVCLRHAVEDAVSR